MNILTIYKYFTFILRYSEKQHEVSLLFLSFTHACDVGFVRFRRSDSSSDTQTAATFITASASVTCCTTTSSRLCRGIGSQRRFPSNQNVGGGRIDNIPAAKGSILASIFIRTCSFYRHWASDFLWSGREFNFFSTPRSRRGESLCVQPLFILSSRYSSRRAGSA